MIGTTPVMATAPMPSCTMKIYMSESSNELVAESVKIGDRLTLAIAIDYQGKAPEALNPSSLFSSPITSSQDYLLYLLSIYLPTYLC